MKFRSPVEYLVHGVAMPIGMIVKFDEDSAAQSCSVLWNCDVESRDRGPQVDIKVCKGKKVWERMRRLPESLSN